MASAFYLGKEIYGSCLMDARAIELATHPRLQLLKVERTHTISIFLETLKQQEGEELLVNILVLSRPLLFWVLFSLMLPHQINMVRQHDRPPLLVFASIVFYIPPSKEQLGKFDCGDKFLLNLL